MMRGLLGVTLLSSLCQPAIWFACHRLSGLLIAKQHKLYESQDKVEVSMLGVAILKERQYQGSLNLEEEAIPRPCFFSADFASRVVRIDFHTSRRLLAAFSLSKHDL